MDGSFDFDLEELINTDGLLFQEGDEASEEATAPLPPARHSNGAATTAVNVLAQPPPPPVAVTIQQQHPQQHRQQHPQQAADPLNFMDNDLSNFLHFNDSNVNVPGGAVDDGTMLQPASAASSSFLLADPSSSSSSNIAFSQSYYGLSVNGPVGQSELKNGCSSSGSIGNSFLQWDTAASTSTSNFHSSDHRRWQASQQEWVRRHCQSNDYPSRQVSANMKDW
jgi:hypothetical protein